MFKFIKKREQDTQLKPPEHDQQGLKDGKVFGYSKGFFIIQISFIVFITLWQILHRVFPSIETIILLTIAMFVWKAQHRALLRDLLPFLILLLSFQGLRGFADNLNFADVHVEDLIIYEKCLFSGTIPSHFLQSRLSDLPYSALIGVVSSIFYMSHFVIPLIVAMILWLKEKSLYWNFITGLLILSYLGFVTYVIYPAAPPWWATENGFLKDQSVYLLPYSIPFLLQFAGPNPVAAMPSLHMAYPTYIMFFCIYVWGKRMVWLCILPLGVAFSTVYLGHHYVIDLIAGVVYALVIFSSLILFNKIRQSHRKTQ